MYEYELKGYHSYTSCRNLSAVEAQGIESSWQPLPHWIVLPSGKKLDWYELYRKAREQTGNAIAEVHSGIWVEYQSCFTPDYYKANGHGACAQKVVIRSNIPLNFRHYSPD